MPIPNRSLPFSQWYDLLIKPTWTPSASTIGTIWAVLYPIIALVYGYALVKVFRGEFPRSLLLPILLNVIFNLAFTPVQFGLRNFLLASFLVVAVCLTALWAAYAIYPHNKVFALLLVPYVVWTAIASVLQLQITWLNR